MSARVDQDLVLSLDQPSITHARVDQDFSLTLNKVTGSHARVDQDFLIVLVKPTTLGGFQDALGNPVAGGKIVFKLSDDGKITNGQAAAGSLFSATLDGSGQIPNSLVLLLNTIILNSQGTNTYYLATVYTVNGELAWRSSFTVGPGWNISQVIPNL